MSLSDEGRKLGDATYIDNANVRVWLDKGQMKWDQDCEKESSADRQKDMAKKNIDLVEITTEKFRMDDGKMFCGMQVWWSPYPGDKVIPPSKKK